MDEKIFNALFAAVDAALYVEDLQAGQIIYWTPAAAALFGYHSGESIQAAQIAAESVEKSSIAESPAEFEVARRASRRFRRADGKEFEAQVTVSQLTLEDRKLAVVGVHVTPQNGHASPGSENSGAETGAASIGQLLRNLANYAVFTTDADGSIREWNQEAGRLLGYEGGEVYGKPVSAICAGDPTRALQKVFDDARDRGASRYYQWLTRKDGRRLYARVATFALSSESHGSGFLFLLRDDSREPNLRQVLQEKEQMAAIGTAASMLAHEIGNPLNGISATVQLLEHCLRRPTPPPTEMLQSSVQDLKSEVRRLNALLSSFKSIAWPVKLALGPVDLRRILEALLGQIEKRSLRQNVEVAFDCQPELPLLGGDDDRLKEALLQVLENALDAMPHGGRLEVKLYRDHQRLCVDIIDTGVGIPKNLKVFDLFSSTKPEGIGLGLFMVQQIVLAHGGAITYSSAPGQGTTFHVSFALNPEPEPVGADFIDAV